MTQALIISALATWLVLEIAGIFFAFDAIMRGRTPQGTVAWAISLVLLPIVAVPVYLLIGTRRFDGYIRARRRGTHILDSLARRTHEAMEPFRASHRSADEAQRLAGSDMSVTRLALTNWTTGNSTQLLIDGEATFRAIITAIEGAQQSVCVQFYIVRDDEIGRLVHRALVESARRGLKVYFLVDAVGSHELSQAFMDDLEEAGVQVATFRTARWWNPLLVNFRNHRKIVVVDGATVFLGGANVGREYLSRDPNMGPWRDTHLRIDGPSALAAQLAFAEDWHWACGEIPELPWEARGCGIERVLILPSGPSDALETCSLLFHQAIHGARRRLWIATAYFVPDEGIVSSLQLAALRGVDTRVIIPDRSDNGVVSMSAYSFYEDVMPAGVEIHRYLPAFLHHKVFLADDVVGIGTANFDNRSFRINFEITALVAGGPLAVAVEEMFARDLAKCHRATLAEFSSRSWFFRALARTCRLMSPVQ